MQLSPQLLYDLRNKAVIDLAHKRELYDAGKISIEELEVTQRRAADLQEKITLLEGEPARIPL